jgi:hypothetical protein
MTRSETTFDAWDVHEIGAGTVTQTAAAITLAIEPGESYSNAQITDYSYVDFQFKWKPPVRLTLTAQASAPAEGLRGTAGFGFWNHPFSPDARRLPRLPQAIWFFFGSPPNDMPLAMNVPGNGWKAATLDAGRAPALLLAPFALPSIFLLRIPALYRRLYPPIQRRLAIHEAALDGDLLADEHAYSIDWRTDGATFAVDGQIVLETATAPRGAAGFIAWIDNQYAIVTPQGRFGWGLIQPERGQWLTLRNIVIDSSAPF